MPPDADTPQPNPPIPEQPQTPIYRPPEQVVSPNQPIQPAVTQVPHQYNGGETPTAPADPTSQIVSSPPTQTPLSGNTYGVSSPAQTVISVTPETTRPSNKRFGVAMALLLLVLIGGAAFAYIMLAKPPTPNQVFRSAIVNALSTSNLTQTANEGTDSVIIKYNLANVKDPSVYTTDTITFNGKLVGEIDGYGTLKNTYAKISHVSGAPTSLENEWIQLRNNDVLPADANPLDTLYPDYDPSYVSLGDYIFGNFSATDRNILTSYILNAYKYDASKVTKTKISGQSVYVYRVTLQNLSTMNQKVAQIMGINNKTAIAYASMGNGTPATMYISTNSKQLLKVTIDGNTATYSAFGTTKLPAAPKPAVQYDTYVKEAGLSNPL
jgi:hypothetical protein